MIKKFISILLIICISGCTSLDVVDTTTSNDLNELIGNNVFITTVDNVKHEFEVTQIDKNYIYGNNVAIPITDVQSIEVETIGLFKTLTLSTVVFLVASGILAGFAILNLF